MENLSAAKFIRIVLAHSNTPIALFDERSNYDDAATYVHQSS